MQNITPLTCQEIESTIADVNSLLWQMCIGQKELNELKAEYAAIHRQGPAADVAKFVQQERFRRTQNNLDRMSKRLAKYKYLLNRQLRLMYDGDDE